MSGYMLNNDLLYVALLYDRHSKLMDEEINEKASWHVEFVSLFALREREDIIYLVASVTN